MYRPLNRYRLSVLVVLWAVVIVCFSCLNSMGYQSVLDRQAVITGAVPDNVSFRMQDDDQYDWDVRSLREYAPCLKVDVRKKKPWQLTIANTGVVGAMDYQLAFSIAIAEEAGQSPTQDIANFRPENQPKEEKDLTGNGTAFLRVIGKDDFGKTTVLAEKMLSPTSWSKVIMPFITPADTVAVDVVFSGIHGGVFFLADMGLFAEDESVSVFLPAQKTLDGLQGQIKKAYFSYIEPGQEYGIFLPGETIHWSLKQPKDAGFTTFDYWIFDGYRRILQRGKGEFGQSVRFIPPQLGYYELYIESRHEADPDSRITDYQGACSITEPVMVEPGGSPWATGGVSKLAWWRGGSWNRGGLHSWTSDITWLSDEDFSDKIALYEEYGVMPQHASNNISGWTNSYVPSDPCNKNDYTGLNQLPADLEQYQRDYAKLAALGDHFVQYFEFWNEPEGVLGSTENWTMENFAAALKAAYRGMKQANPNAKMGVGSHLNILQGIHANDAQDYYDYYIMHPYPWAVGGPWDTPEAGMLLETCMSARTWLDEHGGKDKEIWSTEYGYTTGTTICGCSELQQAQMNTRATLLQIAGGLSRVAPFRMNDVWFWGQVDGRFGFTRGNNTPKPSFVAFAVLTRTLKDLPFRGSLMTEKNIGAFVYGKDDETVLVYWSTQDGKTFTLELGDDVTRVDMYGPQQKLASGVVTMVPGPSVQYLVIGKNWRDFLAQQTIDFHQGYRTSIFETAITHKQWTMPLIEEVPVIDGNLDDWSGDYIDMSDPSQGVKVHIRTAVSDDTFYLMAHVRGRTPGTNMNLPKTIWKGDCVELYFTKEEAHRPVGFYRSFDKHLGFAPGEPGSDDGKAGDFLEDVSPEISSATTKFVTAAEGGYDLEVALPLSYFGIENVRIGDRYGFDIQLDIGDSESGSRRAQLTWSGTGQNYISPYLWGVATVAAP